MNSTPEADNFEIRGRQFILWTRRLLVVAGSLALAYVGLTLAGARLYQAAANRSLDAQIDTKVHGSNGSAAVVREGDVLGRIRIERLDLEVAVLEGTTAETLRLGVGHIEGTALPDEAGNIGIAGHRDTFFRALKDIRTNDEIQLQTATGLNRYQVDWVRIVAPSEIGVLAPSAASTLTLVTCYPFYFIGSAPRRFIVHARKM